MLLEFVCARMHARTSRYCNACSMGLISFITDVSTKLHHLRGKHVQMFIYPAFISEETMFALEAQKDRVFVVPALNWLYGTLHDAAAFGCRCTDFSFSLFLNAWSRPSGKGGVGRIRQRTGGCRCRTEGDEEKRCQGTLPDYHQSTSLNYLPVDTSRRRLRVRERH